MTTGGEKVREDTQNKSREWGRTCIEESIYGRTEKYGTALA